MSRDAEELSNIATAKNIELAKERYASIYQDFLVPASKEGRYFVQLKYVEDNVYPFLLKKLREEKFDVCVTTDNLLGIRW